MLLFRQLGKKDAIKLIGVILAGIPLSILSISWIILLSNDVKIVSISESVMGELKLVIDKSRMMSFPLYFQNSPELA